MYYWTALLVSSLTRPAVTTNLFADELLKVHKLKPNQNWRHHFENYLKTIPVYYAAVSVAIWIHHEVGVMCYVSLIVLMIKVLGCHTLGLI